MTERRYALPEFPLGGLKILDVGCSTGSAFQYPRFAEARSLHGVDVDRRAILDGGRGSPTSGSRRRRRAARAHHPRDSR
jgi:hypothetical protein